MLTTKQDLLLDLVKADAVGPLAAQLNTGDAKAQEAAAAALRQLTDVEGGCAAAMGAGIIKSLIQVLPLAHFALFIKN